MPELRRVDPGRAVAGAPTCGFVAARRTKTLDVGDRCGRLAVAFVAPGHARCGWHASNAERIRVLATLRAERELRELAGACPYEPDPDVTPPAEPDDDLTWFPELDDDAAERFDVDTFVELDEL